MNRRHATLAASLLSVALLMLLLTQTRIIQDVIAPPFYILYFAASSFLYSLPELFFWLIFVIAACQLLLTVVLRNFNLWLERRDRSGRPRTEELPGAVERYMRWIEEESQGSFFKWRLRQQVIQLALATIGRNDPISLSQLERSLQENSLALPEAVTRYLQDGLEARELDRQPRQNTFLGASGRKARDHADLVATLDYLEEVLEI